MTRLTRILDPATGELVLEGLAMEEASALAGDLLPPAREVNCARPLAARPLPAAADADGPTLRVARIDHDPLVDGPGRRSVVQLQDCPIRCPSVISHLADAAGGAARSSARAADPRHRDAACRPQRGERRRRGGAERTHRRDGWNARPEARSAPARLASQGRRRPCHT